MTRYDQIDWAAPRTNDEWTALAAELRAEAARNRKESHDSFQRCDTDGALSQWASDTNSSAYEYAASIADEHGLIEVRALFTLDGEFLTTDFRESENRGWGWGWYWSIPAATATRLGVKRFVNASQAKSPAARAKAYAKKGFTVGTIRVTPYIAMRGRHLTSVSVVGLPDRSAMDAGQFEVVDPRHGDMLDSRADLSDDWRFWDAAELDAAVGWFA